MAQWLKELNVGEWYEAAYGDSFEIVGVDVASELVLVQHFDGALEELEFDAWSELAAQVCAPPEDFSGALDLDTEDLAVDAIASAPHESALDRWHADDVP